MEPRGADVARLEERMLALSRSEQQARESAQQRERETEIIFELSDAANRSLTLTDLYEPALDALCRALRIDRASILLSDEKRIMRFRAWRGLSDGYRAAADGHSPWHPDEPAPRSIFVPDVTTDAALAPFRALFESEGIAALAFIPLFQQRRLLGKFMVYSREPRRFSEHDERIAGAIASHVAQAVLRSELFQAERRERAHAERLAETASRLQTVTAALSTASSVTDVAKVIVEEGARAAGAEKAGLWILDPTEPSAELVTDFEYSDRTRQAFKKLRLDRPPMSMPVIDAIQRREPLWVESRSALERDYPELARATGRPDPYAVACLPLLVENKCVGALALTFDRAHDFSAEERQPLLVLARQCAQAVARARLFDLEAGARAEAEAAHARTSFLLDASALLSTSLDFEETLQRLAQLAVPRMADWCAIELAIEPGAPSQQLAVAHSDPKKVALATEVRRRWPPDPDSPRGVPNVIRTGRSGFAPEVTDEQLVASARDPEHLRVLRELEIRSVMVIPMAARGRTFGAITFVSAESRRRFGARDVELAELLGIRAGSAIDNALLYQAAQTAIRAREKVLAVVSHDLRNPLNVVQLSAATLRRLELPERAAASVARKAETIMNASDRMARLLKDLLDFTGMQSDRFTIAPLRCAADEIVARSVEMFTELARERGVLLETRLATDLPPVECDRDRVIQALTNLVSNAVKVTGKGGSVTVVAEATGTDLILRVEDTGPGIDAGDLPRLFEPYWRGANAGYTGTGLGLAIVRGIAAAHGGRAFAQSTVGVGSRFTLEIPLTPRKALRVPKGAPAPSVSPAREPVAARVSLDLSGGGEMGALMRGFDWSQTPVGPVSGWPQSLKTAVSMLLESRFPMYVAWGPELTQFYNDSFRPILGSTKHPALGKSTRETFSEIWSTIGPMFEGVMGGTAVGFNDFELALDRHGYSEECFFVFSYSPIRDEAGAVGGLLTVCSETTERVVAERRQRALRELARRDAEATNEAQVWANSAAVLEANAADLPFALLYSLDSSDKVATLVARAGAPVPPELAPASLAVDSDDVWPLGRVHEAGGATLVEALGRRSAPIVGSRWPEPVTKALVLPLARGGQRALGFLVAGISPRRALDESYRDFCDLVAEQIGAAVANARAHDDERRRADVLAERVASSDGAPLDATASLYDLFRHVPTPICVLRGPRLVFEMVNDASLRFSGRTQLVGQPYLEAFPEIAGQGFEDRLLEVMRTGEPWVGLEVPARFDRGTGVAEDSIWSLTFVPLRDPGGTIDRVMAVCLEVSNSVGHRKQLADAQREAQAGVRAKDEFFAMLGHELRNPIAPIVTALHLMGIVPDAPFAKERAVIERHLGHVVRLVDDLLDVSRIARGHVAISKRTLDVGALLRKAVENASPILEERRHEVAFDVPAESILVEGDEVRLIQVVANLLTNAAKYTPVQGKIRVSARRGDGTVSLAVADNGMGIDASLLPRVFDLFVQGYRSFDRVEGGLGLGLSIVRSLVALHGGTVAVASEGPGKGSEFTVVLPLAKTTTRLRSEPRAVVPERTRRARRILVVDDNRDAADLLAEAFAAWGHETRRAYDGPSALSLAAEFSPDTALLDLGLPVMDGWELARRLRQVPACREARVFAVTGYGLDSDRSKSRASGFDGHFVKPVDLKAIRAAVDA